LGQFLRDAEVAKSISGAPEFAGASMLFMDKTVGIDTGRATDRSGNWIALFNCSPHLSRAQFSQKATDVASDMVVVVPIL
jgi:hypothetical protein